MKRVYDVYQYIFSGRRVCVRHASYILSANSGKEYEASCHRFLTLTSRCHSLDTLESRLVLVLATDGDQYLEQHPSFADGQYTAPLIGVITLDPVPDIV